MDVDFKALYHQAPCGYLYAKEDGTLIEVNDTFLAFTGYQREEIIENKRIEDFLTIGGKIYYETHFSPLLHMRGEVSQINFDFIRKNETRFPVLINAMKQSDKEKHRTNFQFVVLDITQRKQYESELLHARRKSDELLMELSAINEKLTANMDLVAEQRNELEKLNATKDKFFSIVAHDLKSPLNSLKAFSVLLIDHYDSLSKEEILSMSQQLKNSVDNTIKMANNLITWARIQMNDIQYIPETIKVKELVGNICDVYKDVAINKGLNVSCIVGDSLSIHGDKNQIEFVIRNLVNNAIKFTHSGGSVSLTANSISEEEIEISVSDSGVGISDEMKDKLFTIGKTQSAHGTAGEKGTGLGLLLSYEFIKLNGGQVLVESKLGKGTIFSVRFKKEQ